MGDDQKLKLGKLKDAVSLICLLSRDKQIAIFELDLEGFELLSFTLTSKYIKRELTIFNELLEKASQICEYANVSEEIKVSLKDLYYFRKEIEQFIQKTDRNRAEYYKYHTGRDWIDAMNYDLCLNSKELSFEKCDRIIRSYMDIKFEK